MPLMSRSSRSHPPRRTDLPQGTYALFAAVEGSTRLLHEIGDDAYAEVLAQHHRVCRDSWRAHRDVEVDL
jgi:class 3 adenylate cyclase